MKSYQAHLEAAMTNESEQAALAYQKSSLEWQQRYNIAIAERDALRKDAARLYEALVTLGITKGEVDKQERWWHIRPDGSEVVHANVMLAADALWADYRARTADAEVQP
jgi:hypothetical protein